MHQKMAAQNQVVPGWEHLVTEGHVRAARLRTITPLIVALGIALVVLGVFGFAYLSAQSGPSSFNPQELLTRKTQEYKRPVLERMRAFYLDRSFAQEEIAKIADQERLSKAVQNILTELENKEALPEDGFQKLSAKDFWEKPWPNDAPVTTALVVTKDGLVAVGAIVNAGNERSPVIKQWIGLFKKEDGGLLSFGKKKWVFASLAGPQLYVLPDKPSVKAEDVAVSLRRLMDMEDGR